MGLKGHNGFRVFAVFVIALSFSITSCNKGGEPVPASVSDAPSTYKKSVRYASSSDSDENNSFQIIIDGITYEVVDLGNGCFSFQIFGDTYIVGGESGCDCDINMHNLMEIVGGGGNDGDIDVDNGLQIVGGGGNDGDIDNSFEIVGGGGNDGDIEILDDVEIVGGGGNDGDIDNNSFEILNIGNGKDESEAILNQILNALNLGQNAEASPKSSDNESQEEFVPLVRVQRHP